MNTFVLLILGFLVALSQNQQVSIIPAVQEEIGEGFLKPGNYRVEFIDARLPTMEINVSENQLRFRGCNVNIMPYKTEQSGQITFSEGISTRMMCPGDMDASYVQEIIKVKSIQSIGNEFNWKNSEGKVIMMAQKLNR